MRAQRLATTPRRDSNTPDTSPLEHRCQTRVQVASSTSPFVRDRPVDRPAPLWLRNLERCVHPLLDRPGLQPAHSCARLCVRHGAWSPLVFSFCLAFFQLRCADSQGFFSSCALRTAHLACTDQAGLSPPPHPLVGFFCICVFRLSLRGEVGYSSSHRRLL